MAKQFYNFILIVLIFFLLYYPPILPINIIHVMFVFSSVYICIAKRGVITKDLLLIIEKYSLPLILLMLYLIIVVFINTLMISIDTSIFILAIEVIPTIYVICDIKNRKAPTTDFTQLIICVGVIQAIIAYATLIVPSLHEQLVTTYIDYGYGEVMEILSVNRLYGLSYGLTFGMPIVQSLIAIIAFYSGIRKGWGNYFASIFIFGSAVINARTSLVVYAIGVIGILLATSRWQFTKTVKTLLAITVIIGFAYYFFDLIESYNDTTAEWIEDGYNDIMNFLKREKYSEYSYFEYVESRERFKLPDNFNWILGVGERCMGGNSWGYYSDVGYVNDIWYGGIVYCSAIMIFFITRFLSIFKNKQIIDKGLAVMKYVGVLIFLVVNIKGYFFSQNEAIHLILLYCIYEKLNQNFGQSLVKEVDE